MKKAMLLLTVLLVMIAWYPLLVISGWAQEFTVTLRFPLVTCVVLTLMFALVGMCLLRGEHKKTNLVTSVLSSLLVPFSIVNISVWVWENRSFWILVLTSVWVVFAVLVMYTYGNHSFFQGVVMGGSAVVLLAVLLLSMFFLFFSFGRVTVVRTVPSPEGTYYAELIDDDQGALGGNTLVKVYDTRKRLDLHFLSVYKNPQQVYWGRWGEFEDMKLEWESEQVLLINGRSYEVE